jgi:hypothetical protein
LVVQLKVSIESTMAMHSEESRIRKELALTGQPTRQQATEKVDFHVSHPHVTLCYDSWTDWPLKMRLTGCPKTSVTTTSRSITSQKGNDLSGLHLNTSKYICCILGLILWCLALWSGNVQQIMHWFLWPNKIHVRGAQIPGHWISEGGAKYFQHNYSMFPYVKKCVSLHMQRAGRAG